MSKNRLLDEVLVDTFGLNRIDAQEFVASMFTVIATNLEQDKMVKVKGLGTFKLAEMSQRESIDVNTGERILIESRNKISFTPENALRDRINAPFASFESVDIDDDADFESIDSKYMTEDKTPRAEVSKTTPVEQTLPAQQAAQPQPETPRPEMANEHLTREYLRGIVAELFKEQIAEAEERARKQAIEELQRQAQPVQPAQVTQSEPESAKDTQSELELEPIAETEKPTQSYPDDDEDENDENDGEISRSVLFKIIGILVLALILCSGYFCYHIGLFDQMMNQNVTEKPIEKDVSTAELKDTIKVPVEKPDSVSVKVEIPMVKVTVEDKKPDTQPKHPQTKPEEKKPVWDTAITKYDSDSRIRTGAYVILGIDKEVTVQQGQTFEGITKAYLGKGMECYVEAVNNGKTSYTAGDRIKIPKLMHKKQYNKLHK